VQRQDLVLSAGQERVLPVGKYPTVVLMLGDQPIVVEVQSRTAPRLSA
jgi:tRNA U54 and U55 pseudouridine synthase Pus10